MESIENTDLKNIIADSSSYTDEDWKKYLSTAVRLEADNHGGHRGVTVTNTRVAAVEQMIFIT